MASQFCTLGSSVPRFPASGSSAAPPALQPTTRPPNPLSLPIPASLSPEPPILPPLDPQRPFSPSNNHDPHLSLTPAPSAPQSRSKGFRTPTSPRASRATPPLSALRATPAGPAHFPSPAGAAVAQTQLGSAGWSMGVGPGLCCPLAALRLVTSALSFQVEKRPSSWVLPAYW